MDDRLSIGKLTRYWYSKLRVGEINPKARNKTIFRLFHRIIYYHHFSWGSKLILEYVMPMESILVSKVFIRSSTHSRFRFFRLPWLSIPCSFCSFRNSTTSRCSRSKNSTSVPPCYYKTPFDLFSKIWTTKYNIVKIPNLYTWFRRETRKLVTS